MMTTLQRFRSHHAGRIIPAVFFIACIFSLDPSVSAENAAPPLLGVGATFESLQVGATVYQKVKVRTVTPHSLVISHSGGLSSIRLRDLPPEWQARFGYSAEAEAAAEKSVHPIPPTEQKSQPPASSSRQQGETESKFERLLQSFGEQAQLAPDVNLRPKFLQLELGVKNQGRRPSCSVFAIVSALEFQNAEVIGEGEKLSEEYLIWATRKILNRVPMAAASAAAADETGDEDKDEGFSLFDVVTALRTYGIPLQSAMPDTFGRKMSDIAEPEPQIVAEARARRRVYVHNLPGRNNATHINNLVLALNAGVPVVVGLRWPHYRTLRSGYLSEQKPILDYTHAVTLVGYKCPTGRIEDIVFIFKNSWGAQWGSAGYGQVTYRYLNSYLLDAVLLEVQRDNAGT